MLLLTCPLFRQTQAQQLDDQKSLPELVQVVVCVEEYQNLVYEPAVVKFAMALNLHFAAFQREMYETRSNLGGYYEEIWYSKYRIGCCHMLLDEQLEGEYKLLQAFDMCPHRVEPLMILVKHFRENDQRFKAWHYLLQAMKIPKPKSPCLFLEENAYSHTKDFEMTLLLYYISPDRDFGMDCCLKYKGPNDELVLYNIPFYAKQISSLEWKQLKFPVPEGFVSSSIGVNQAGTMSKDTTVTTQHQQYICIDMYNLDRLIPVLRIRGSRIK